MNQSSNAADGALQFHLSVTKNEDGTHTASCKAQPGVKPVTASSHSTAVNTLRQNLQKAAGAGGLKGV